LCICNQHEKIILHKTSFFVSNLSEQFYLNFGENQNSDRVFNSIIKLEDDERVKEVAKLLGSEVITETPLNTSKN
jgi:DNA repair ATPase RecN